MLRLFSALELPDLAKIALSSLKAPYLPARWVTPDDYHITLQFIGEVSRRQADEFAHQLADIHVAPPEIRIRGTAAFGGKQPHAIYAVVEPTEALDRLQRAHEHAARAVGITTEKRKFIPHVTLARLDRVDDDTVARFLSQSGGLKVPPFRPVRAVLMSAERGGGGPYGVVDRFPFEGQYDPDSYSDDT